MSVCHRPGPFMYQSEQRWRLNGVLMLHKKQKLCSYLFQTSTLGANKSYTVAIVDVGGDGSHAVPSLGVERVTRHQLRPSEGLIDVQATERVINGHRLPGRTEEEKTILVMLFSENNVTLTV